MRTLKRNILGLPPFILHPICKIPTPLGRGAYWNKYGSPYNLKCASVTTGIGHPTYIVNCNWEFSLS